MEGGGGFRSGMTIEGLGQRRGYVQLQLQLQRQGQGQVQVQVQVQVQMQRQLQGSFASLRMTAGNEQRRQQGILLGSGAKWGVEVV